MMKQPRFLPMSPEEGKSLGINEFDVIIISGDAYVDHPSFATAILGRVLWDAGFSVGIVAQPNWNNTDEFKKLGEPRLFFAIAPGNVDSMVNHFAPSKKRRKIDQYSEGGVPKRPDRAVIVYSNIIRKLYPESPITIGGIEASLRRLAHYDYWSDSVRQSILADAPADILVYGMGERQIIEIANLLHSGRKIKAITQIRGTCEKISISDWKNQDKSGIIELPDYISVKDSTDDFARAFVMQYQENNPYKGRKIAQRHPKTVIIQNPPAYPLSIEEIDHIYELPFSRGAHPSYRGRIPALETVKFSITSHRGCYGECSFCALSNHQGRIIQSRSCESIIREVRKITRHPDFRGTITDVGGPTANMYMSQCPRWSKSGACSRTERATCIGCPSLAIGEKKYLDLLGDLSEIRGVKHVFISSGIRFDLIGDEEFLDAVYRNNVSGHLKVAPEHVSESVTRAMNKPSREIFDMFLEMFARVRGKKPKQQFVLPYFMSGHPGCRIIDMIECAEYIRDKKLYTEQVQDFTPTPMTVSTCMYHTGKDPFTGEEIHVPKGREKTIQRAMLHYRDQKNSKLVIEGLEKSGRTDLIGGSPLCLVNRPYIRREKRR